MKGARVRNSNSKAGVEAGTVADGSQAFEQYRCVMAQLKKLSRRRGRPFGLRTLKRSTRVIHKVVVWEGEPAHQAPAVLSKVLIPEEQPGIVQVLNERRQRRYEAALARPVAIKSKVVVVNPDQGGNVVPWCPPQVSSKVVVVATHNMPIDEVCARTFLLKDIESSSQRSQLTPIPVVALVKSKLVVPEPRRASALAAVEDVQEVTLDDTVALLAVEEVIPGVLAQRVVEAAMSVEHLPLHSSHVTVPKAPIAYCYGQKHARAAAFKVLLQERRKILSAEEPRCTKPFSQRDMDSLLECGYVTKRAAITRLRELKQRRMELMSSLSASQ